MTWALSLYRSTIGKKIIMAFTGLIGIGFVIAHMAGNLQVFIGAEKLNGYGAMLHGPLNELVWLQRVLLIGALILHVLMAWQLTQRAKAARPVGYTLRIPQVSTLASRTMRWGGVFLLLFIVLHIAHFTMEAWDPAGWAGRVDAGGRRDTYGNMVASFRIWWVALIYIVAMVFLGLHLFHGAWSSMRTLGLAKPSPRPMVRHVSVALALIIWLGFTLVPLGVVLGLVK